MPTVSFRPLLTISEVGSNSIPNDATGTKAVDGSQPTNKDTTADSQLTTGATADVKPVNEQHRGISLFYNKIKSEQFIKKSQQPLYNNLTSSSSFLHSTPLIFI
jgi:hypothetical protein